MKAQLFDAIETTVDVTSDRDPARTFPAGARGAVVDVLQTPSEAYLVDLELPEPDPGGATTEDVLLLPEQFDVVWQYPGPST